MSAIKHQHSPSVTGIASNSIIDFSAVNELAEGRMDELLDAMDAYYQMQGNELVMLNPHRTDNELGSFKFNLEKGAWSDFATGDCGGDAVSLIAYYRDISQSDAARFIQQTLNDPAGEAAANAASFSAESPKSKNSRLRLVANNTQVRPVPTDAPEVPQRFPRLGTPENVYPYRDASGDIEGYILRFLKADGGKEIRPLTLHRTETGELEWQFQNWDGQRPLYRLDQIAAHADKPIIIGEGEKTADALAQLFPGHVTTTTIGGANAVKKADLAPLKGRPIYLWPDNDSAGLGYAKDLVDELRRLDPNAVIWQLETFNWHADGQGQLVAGENYPAGYDAADALAAGWTEVEAEALLRTGFVQLTAPAQESARETQEWNTPVGQFLLNKSGVYSVTTDKEGMPRLHWLASWLKVRGHARNTQGRGWGIVVDFRKPDGTLDSDYLAQTDLQGTAERGLLRLADQGVTIISTPKQRQELADYLKSSGEELPLVFTTTKTGWTPDGTFVLPEAIIGAHAEEWVYIGAPETRSIYQRKGTLLDWQTAVAQPCIGNSRLILGVCVALSGPLQYLLGAENGGVHLRGNSSIGKSVALSVAQSLWSPAAGMCSWRTTDNALELAALARNDTVLTLDEMSQAAPAVVGASAYLLGNGQIKGRAQANMAPKPIEHFRCQCVSTGEVSLNNHLIAGGQRAMAGQDVRFIDIPADAGVGFGLFECLHTYETASALAEGIRADARRYYGVAGPALIERLSHDRQENHEALLQQLRTWQSSLMQQVPADSNSQIHRIASRFALYAAAGEYAIATGVLPWPEGEALRGISVCFRAWLAERGGLGSLEMIQALRQVREFLERWGSSRFAPWENDTEYQRHHDNALPLRVPNQAGYLRHEDIGLCYYVFPEVFNGDLCEGLNPRTVKQWLIEAGWLRVDKDGKAPTTVNLPSEGSKRFYVLLPKALTDELPTD